MFLTAFDEYAVKAFEEHAFDYLLKPIEAARLEKTLARLRRERNLQDVSLLDDAQQTLKYIPPVPATVVSGCCRWRMWPSSAAG